MKSIKKKFNIPEIPQEVIDKINAKRKEDSKKGIFGNMKEGFNNLKAETLVENTRKNKETEFLKQGLVLTKTYKTNPKLKKVEKQ